MDRGRGDLGVPGLSVRLIDSHTRLNTRYAAAATSHWPRSDFGISGSGISEMVQVTVCKHPYPHPYGIASCVP